MNSNKLRQFLLQFTVHYLKDLSISLLLAFPFNENSLPILSLATKKLPKSTQIKQQCTQHTVMSVRLFNLVFRFYNVHIHINTGCQQIKEEFCNVICQD